MTERGDHRRARVKRDATPDVVLNQLYRFSTMQISFACNMLALNGGRPVSIS